MIDIILKNANYQEQIDSLKILLHDLINWKNNLKSIG